MFFSIAKVAFINVSAWPDCVEVSNEVYEDIMGKVRAGSHTLGADAQGPIAVPVVLTELTADQVYQVRLSELNNDYEVATGNLRSGYPLSESISWGDQFREATEFVAAGAETEGLSTPFLDALHLARAEGIEETKLELAQRIIYLHGVITPPFAAITGKRHLAERELTAAKEAAEPVTALRAVSWDLTV